MSDPFSVSPGPGAPPGPDVAREIRSRSGVRSSLRERVRHEVAALDRGDLLVRDLGDLLVVGARGVVAELAGEAREAVLGLREDLAEGDAVERARRVRVDEAE